MHAHMPWNGKSWAFLKTNEGFFFWPRLQFECASMAAHTFVANPLTLHDANHGRAARGPCCRWSVAQNCIDHVVLAV